MTKLTTILVGCVIAAMCSLSHGQAMTPDTLRRNEASQQHIRNQTQLVARGWS